MLEALELIVCFKWTDDEVASSLSLRKPDHQISKTKLWLQEIAPLQLTISLVLSYIHPEQFQAGKNALDRSCNAELYPRTAEWAKIWGSVFTALTVISGRKAIPHIDSHGSCKLLDALVTLGTAQGANINLLEIGATLAYKPGTSVFFSGRGWTHEVPDWGFGERVCYASYARPEMMAEHEMVVQGFGLKLGV